MTETNEELLNGAIEDQIERLNRLSPNDETFTEVVDTIVKLQKLDNEKEKSRLDYDKHYYDEDVPEEPVVFTIEQVANKTGLSKTTINRRCLYKDYPNAKKIDGIWWIPEADFQKDIKEGK